MPTADRTQASIMSAAYAVKTGTQALKDLPDGTREKVKSTLRAMGDQEFRKYATTQTKVAGRRVAQRGQQTRVRRARAV